MSKRVQRAKSLAAAKDWKGIVNELGRLLRDLDSPDRERGLDGPVQRVLTKSLLVLAAAILQRAIEEFPPKAERAKLLKPLLQHLAEAVRQTIDAMPPQ
jgi:hypothetical protein